MTLEQKITSHWAPVNWEPKERPILFKTEMVEGILDGRKTQTRRGLKEGQLVNLPKMVDHLIFMEGQFWACLMDGVRIGSIDIKCPFGQPGDRLWVKETFAYFDADKENAGYVYKASENGQAWASNDPSWKWKPSLFMPREASRINLEITDIRVERLLSISEEDAIAEGVKLMMYQNWDNQSFYQNYTYKGGNDKYFPSVKSSYMSLWDSINGKDSHKLNPWLWVIEFKHI